MPNKDKKKVSTTGGGDHEVKPKDEKRDKEPKESKEKGKPPKDKGESKERVESKEKDLREKEPSRVEQRKKESRIPKIEEMSIMTSEPEVIIPVKTPSQIAKEQAELRAEARRMRFKRRWPEVTKAKFRMKPWHPPPPPQRPPPVVIDLPELTKHRWVPPYLRKHRPRAKRPRIMLEEMTRPPPAEVSKLRKIWHNFMQVDTNKMMCQGSIGCNSKKYSATHCGAQTACIAVACRALLEEKTPAQFVRRDVDDLIETGDRFYKRCIVALKCYKGKPALQLNQILTSFFMHDTKYTVKMLETDKGILAKHPDNLAAGADLMDLMEKRTGQTYMLLLSIDGEKHFLIWGHPPDPAGGSQAKTICYIFDPHMLNEIGGIDKLNGAGAFIRYAGITSFVVDFLANYGDMDAAKKLKPKPPITLTLIEVVQKEPLLRDPTFGLDLKALKTHCRSEWDSLNVNALLDKKKYEGQHIVGSLSAVSLATSRANSRKKVREFYQQPSREPPMELPVNPEKPPVNPTAEQLLTLRGENFFLYSPTFEGHMFGRDDMVPLPKEEKVLHSLPAIAHKNFHSQYKSAGAGQQILRGTRHMASYRYQKFKTYTAIPCCVAALGMLQRYRARAWNEDMLDETYDIGYNMYRESLLELGGPIRRLVLGELKDTFKIRDREYNHKVRGIAVWGKLVSSNPKVFDLCRGIEHFFKESDSGILQVPGEYETAIWHEGGKYYLYHPWPADARGNRVGLQDGGKGCVMCFSRISKLCDYFMDNCSGMKKMPFSISDVHVYQRGFNLPPPVNKMKPIAPNRWIVRGSFHEGDARFPVEHRGRQATPVAITALAMAHVVDPNGWTTEDVNETLVRGDQLYQSTMEHLEKMGISMDTTPPSAEEGQEEAAAEVEETPSGTLAAADVLNRFKVSNFDCVETDVMDSTYTGTVNPEGGSGAPPLKTVLNHFFKDHTHGVFTARGASTAIWKHQGHFFLFDPHGCDENGLPSDEPRSTACLVRVKGNVNELADVMLASLAPGADDSFNISPVSITATKLNPEIGAPELPKLENKQFEWIKKGTAAIMMGPRGQNSAIGKSAEKCGIGVNNTYPTNKKSEADARLQLNTSGQKQEDDMAGRTLGLVAAAAFAAASESVPPPYMHQDHMYNILDAAADYYLHHLKKTGRKDIAVEDLSEKFEMGANTFSVELGEPMRLPLRLPDETPGEGEGGGDEKEGLGEGEEEVKVEFKHMKDFLFKMWYDTTHPTTISLLLGDYHQLGLWMSAGGKVVAFDPAPTLAKGLLTKPRIKKGDELRIQRLKDEMTGESAGDDDEELGGEGEEKPVPEPEFVPPESCPVLIVAASPGEFIDKLVTQGNLNNKQMIAPYKLYPVKVTNELTQSLKEKRPGSPKEKAADGEEETGPPEEELVPALEDATMGKYMTRLSRTTGSVRAALAQNENYFLDQPNRDNQDTANSMMGIVVEHIEPYQFWKPELMDAVLKYGDRLHTMSIGNAKQPPKLKPHEIVNNFHVTNFNIKLEVERDVIGGDTKAGEGGSVNSIKQALTNFFTNHKHGILCSKGYCVAIWKGVDDASYCMFEPHAVGPTGRSNPAGAATLVIYADIDELADTFRDNVDGTMRAGDNKFTISAVKVFWEFSKLPSSVTPQGTVPDEGYEWKVLTAFVETARGRTILRGSRPPDPIKFTRDALIQSACGAIVGAAMSQVRRPHLWTRRTIDEVMAVACKLFIASTESLGYEFRPGEDILLPLQVKQRFVLGVNYVRFDLDEIYNGKMENKDPQDLNLKLALERFFEMHNHGILWSMPHAVCVWRVRGAPQYYMLEPHACGPTGLRVDAMNDGAACLLTFTSPKLMAFSYLQNIPLQDRVKKYFQLYAITTVVTPIKKLTSEPPLVRGGGGAKVVPATSKVGVGGKKRQADEQDRKHPPGSATCVDAQRAADQANAVEETLNKAVRNTAGWLVLNDGTRFMSAGHSIACKKFPSASRGYQALPCCVMAVAMNRVDEVCRWCTNTLDQILESGDQLYQDSYLHFHPPTKYLDMEQILRKFYTPGNCVCRVVVYKPRQNGIVDQDLYEMLLEFFREEKQGVFITGNKDFAVALFRTPRGYYMFDPMDRDRYGRAVAPPCIGKARACFSQYPNIRSLSEKLGPNIPPVRKAEEPKKEKEEGGGGFFDKVAASAGKALAAVKVPGRKTSEVRFSEAASFTIYGMDVTGLRRLNKYER